MFTIKNLKSIAMAVVTTTILLLPDAKSQSAPVDARPQPGSVDAKPQAVSTERKSQSNLKGIKNVVLVHGAFADGSSWSKVVIKLQAKGYNVIAAQNPLTSFDDDVAAAKRAIALMDGPVLLVGHSWWNGDF